ncbi:MAG: hypothetical protein ACTHKK_10910 [Candidatus Nitrosocosmicus sp.]
MTDKQSNSILNNSLLIKTGAIGFIAGIIIFLISSVFHPAREPADNRPLVFAEYAKSDSWIAVHLGQFVGYMLIYVVGFVALYRFLYQSQFGIPKLLVQIGLIMTIITASLLAFLQEVDGISLKMAVDSWSTSARGIEKISIFHVAEGIRWIEIATNSFSRILHGAVAIIFGTAIITTVASKKSSLIPRWNGAIGIFAGIVTIITGISTGYLGFASNLTGITMVSYSSYIVWTNITGIYMWKRSDAKSVL